MPVLSLKGNRFAKPLTVQENLRQVIEQVKRKNTQKPECGWEGKGNNELYFVTVRAVPNPVATPTGDYMVKLPAPYKHFMLVSCTDEGNNNSLYLHLDPLSIAYTVGSPAITPQGTERWFSMKAANSAGDTTGSQLLKFSKGVDQIYLDFGYESGGSTPWSFTFLCSNGDFDFVTNFTFNQSE